MFNRRLLFLTRDRLTAFHWSKGGVDGPPQRFTPDAKGREAFSEWVVKEPKIPVYVLADYIEEEFKNDSQPHVLGPDRSTLTDLRMARAFPATPYRHAMIVGRSKEGRKDDITLLAGLTEPGSVSAWIDILMEKKIPLTGIFSLPLVSGHLLRYLRIQTPSTLLVSQQSSSGMRFTYFQGSVMKMSRMAPVPDLAPEKYTALFRAELDKTRGYLGSLRLLPKDHPLTVVVLTNADLIRALEPHCQESATARFKMVEVGEAARNIGIKRTITTPFSDSLFIQLLGRQPGFNHYATPAQIGPYYTRLLYQWLYGAAGAMAAVSLLMAVWDLYGGVDLMLKSGEAKEQTEMYRKKFRQALSKQTDTTVLPVDVRGTVELVEQLEAHRADPREMMLVMSAVLDGHPDIVLDTGYKWIGPLQPQHPSCTKELRKRPQDGDETVDGGGVRQHGTVHGRVVLREGMDVKRAKEQLNAFVSALLKRPEVLEVCVGDVQAQKQADAPVTLSAKAKEEVVVENPAFELGVTMRVGKGGSDAASGH